MNLKDFKKINPLYILSFVILFIDLLALDDITTGNEPNKWEEWDFLLFSLIFFGLLAYSKHPFKKLSGK